MLRKGKAKEEEEEGEDGEAAASLRYFILHGDHPLSPGEVRYGVQYSRAVETGAMAVLRSSRLIHQYASRLDAAAATAMTQAASAKANPTTLASPATSIPPSSSNHSSDHAHPHPHHHHPFSFETLLLDVDGFSVLDSPRVRDAGHYVDWFIPREVQAAHDFTRKFAAEQRSLSRLLSPPSCLRPRGSGSGGGLGGVLGTVPWYALSHQSALLLDLWQVREEGEWRDTALVYLPAASCI